MGAPEPDPRYAARFQRGWTGNSDALPAAAADVEPPDEELAARVRRAAVGPAVFAVVVAVLAAAALAWACLDPAFRTPPHPNALAAARVVAAAAPGPLAVAVVVAVALGLRRAAPRAGLLVAAGVAVAAAVAVVATGAGIARLASLTAQGPVSSGGIPLPDAAMAVYAQRVQAIGMLTSAMPGLILAAALALLLVVAIGSRALVPRPVA